MVTWGRKERGSSWNLEHVRKAQIFAGTAVRVQQRVNPCMLCCAVCLGKYYAHRRLLRFFLCRKTVKEKSTPLYRACSKVLTPATQELAPGRHIHVAHVVPPKCIYLPAAVAVHACSFMRCWSSGERNPTTAIIFPLPFHQ